MIQQRHPVLDNVWGTMDGLKCRIEQPADLLVQRHFYNVWKCDHFITTVLCFSPDGTIPAAFLMSLVAFMTVRLHIGDKFMINLKAFVMRPGISMLLIWHSVPEHMIF